MKKNPRSNFYSACHLCPRSCNADRSKSFGFCRSGADVTVADYLPHMWEEPCISGSHGAGAIFFSGCCLGCVYCQNADFSRGCAGRVYSADELAGLFLLLQNKGVHNIDLVTPTHFQPTILDALDIAGDSLRIPVIWNTSGYELPERIEELSGYADIFLTDFKYSISERAKRYSFASDYPEYARLSIDKMLKIAGPMTFDTDGIMQSGVIIRHLMLPGGLADTKAVLADIASLLARYGTGYAAVSLMSQYTNNKKANGFSELERKITTLEYQRACEYMDSLGLTGFLQERSSSAEGYVPLCDK